MSTPLFFKIKDSVDVDKFRFLELFFKDWVDGVCDKEVCYKIERNVVRSLGNISYHETLRVDFNRQEDALAMTLKGIPKEFQSYLEIIK